MAAAIIVSFSLPVRAQAQTAQSADADTFVIEEIVVQSRKRSENLQDVPATISAFTEADIESIGVSNMRDYANLVPNFFLVETQASAFTFVNIRGITQMRNLDPSVAIVVDGVLSTNSIAMSQELFDVQQIEVLKGPQGALYGRNAMGGAINITTKRPSNELEGFVRAGYGNGQSGKIQASMSGPLVEDQLFGRVAVSFYDSKGHRENTALGIPSDPQENISARARLLWTPSETFEADLRFSISDDNSAALQFIDIAPIFHEIFPGGPILGSTIVPPGAPAAIFPPGHPFFDTAVRGGDGVTIPDLVNPLFPGCGNCGNVNLPGLVPVQNNLNGIDERRIYNLSLLMNWESSVGTLTAVTSFDKVIEFAIGEQPIRTADAIQKNTQWRFSEAISQELRLTSPDDQRLRWIVGAYIVQTDTFLGSTTQFDATGLDTKRDLVKRDPSVAPDGICMGNPFPLTILSDPDNRASPHIPNPAADPSAFGACIRGFDGDQGDNLAYAFFAQVNYDVTDTLELSFSARYDRDERTQIVRTPQLFLDRFQDPMNPDILTDDVRKANFDSFQPKVTLRWIPQDNLTTYVSFAKGFRSGGFNRPGIELLADSRRAGANPPIPLGVEDIYPQQDTSGVEGGFKFQTAGGRFIANVAAFYTKVDNYQTFTAVTIGTLLSQVIIPVTKVEIVGIEFDATAHVHEYLSINVGFAYNDSEVKRDDARGTIVAPPPTFVGVNAFNTLGNKAPQTPTTTLNIGGQFSMPVNLGTMEANVFLRADYQRIGELFFMVENISKRKPLSLVNIRGGVEIEGSWRLEAWAKNLTNEDYFAEGFNPAGFFFPGKLREWGFELTKRF